MSTQHTSNGADNRLTYTREQLTTARQQRDELLAALRAIEADDHSPHDVLRAIARAAIAKVTQPTTQTGGTHECQPWCPINHAQR